MIHGRRRPCNESLISFPSRFCPAGRSVILRMPTAYDLSSVISGGTNVGHNNLIPLALTIPELECADRACLSIFLSFLPTQLTRDCSTITYLPDGIHHEHRDCLRFIQLLGMRERRSSHYLCQQPVHHGASGCISMASLHVHRLSLNTMHYGSLADPHPCSLNSHSIRKPKRFDEKDPPQVFQSLVA
uniref:Uncharacterized protein n=1 Tax=Sphaerodactylus townsendi TaxID=933632 RepID=A0ACB8ESU7_9SAUR